MIQRQLGVFGHVALDEHGGDVGVEADGEEHGRQLDGACADDAGRLGDGEGVQVDDAVERVACRAGRPPSCAAPRGSCRGARRRSAACTTGPGSAPRGRRVGRGGGRGGGSHGARGYTSIAATHSVVCGPMSFDVDDPVYEGPFDLLLQLILREQVDIYEVSLATHRRRLPGRDRAACSDLDLDVATEFLLIAATLVELKARRLLPGTADVRPRRGARAVGGARPAAGPPARVQDVQGRRHGVRPRWPTTPTAASPASSGPTSASPTSMPDLLEGTSLAAAAQRGDRGPSRPRPMPTVDLFHVNPITTTRRRRRRRAASTSCPASAASRSAGSPATSSSASR